MHQECPVILIEKNKNNNKKKHNQPQGNADVSVDFLIHDLRAELTLCCKLQ